MVLIDELVPRSDYPEEVRDLSFWKMGAEDVTRAHLLGLFYRVRLRANRTVATTIAERIADAICMAYESGQVRNGKLKGFKAPQSPMLVNELADGLRQLQPVARKCVYFALLMDWDLEQAIDLKWTDLKHLQRFEHIHDAAMDVIESIPRHIHTPHIFWAYGDDNRADRIRYVRSDLEIAFSVSFEELRERFNVMALVDSTSDSESFQQLFGQIDKRALA